MVLLLNKITKIESNSQPLLPVFAMDSVVLLLNKITKIESNSQLLCRRSPVTHWCFY